MKTPKELFEENAEAVHPDLPKLMNQDTFIRLWNEYQPKWISVKEFQNLNHIIALSKEYDIICSDGENTLMGYLWNKDGVLMSDNDQDYSIVVKYVFVVPPLLTEK